MNICIVAFTGHDAAVGPGMAGLLRPRPAASFQEPGVGPDLAGLRPRLGLLQLLQGAGGPGAGPGSILLRAAGVRLLEELTTEHILEG